MERAAAVKFARSCTFSYLQHAGTLRPFVHLFTRVCLLFQSVCAASGRFTRSSTQFTGGACEFSTWGTCLPSPPEAFLGDPPSFWVLTLFSLLGSPPFLRRTFLYLDALPRVLKRSACAQGSLVKYCERLKLLKGTWYKDPPKAPKCSFAIPPGGTEKSRRAVLQTPCEAVPRKVPVTPT